MPPSSLSRRPTQHWAHPCLKRAKMNSSGYTVLVPEPCSTPQSRAWCARVTAVCAVRITQSAESHIGCKTNRIPATFMYAWNFCAQPPTTCIWPMFVTLTHDAPHRSSILLLTASPTTGAQVPGHRARPLSHFSSLKPLKHFSMHRTLTGPYAQAYHPTAFPVVPALQV